MARTPGSLRYYAEVYSVSPSTISSWARRGVDLSDPEAVAAHRSSLQENRAEESVELQEARRQLTIKQTRLLELKIADVERRLVPIEDVEAGYELIGEEVAAAVGKIERDLPALLAGKSAREMKRCLRPYLRERLRELADG